MSNLVKYAEEELRRSIWLDNDGPYNGQVGRDVLALIKVFAEQGHSGGSAYETIALFQRLAHFQPLTPLTYAPDQWTDVSEAIGRPTWQHKRRASVFSRDGGKTHFDTSSRSWNFRRRLSYFLGEWVLP